MIKHTPGPWSVSECGSIEFGDGFLGEAYDFNGTTQTHLPMMANARLMAAAPEMLRLIQRLTSPYMAEMDYRMDAFIDAAALINELEKTEES